MGTHAFLEAQFFEIGTHVLPWANQDGKSITYSKILVLITSKHLTLSCRTWYGCQHLMHPWCMRKAGHGNLCHNLFSCDYLSCYASLHKFCTGTDRGKYLWKMNMFLLLWLIAFMSWITRHVWKKISAQEWMCHALVSCIKSGTNTENSG